MSFRQDIDDLIERVDELTERLEKLECREPEPPDEEHACRVDIGPIEEMALRLERIEDRLAKSVTRATLPARIAGMLRSYEPKAGDHGKLSTEGWDMVKRILADVANRLDLLA